MHKLEVQNVQALHHEVQFYITVPLRNNRQHKTRKDSEISIHQSYTDHIPQCIIHFFLCQTDLPYKQATMDCVYLPFNLYFDL